MGTVATVCDSKHGGALSTTSFHARPPTFAPAAFLCRPAAGCGPAPPSPARGQRVASGPWVEGASL